MTQSGYSDYGQVFLATKCGANVPKRFNGEARVNSNKIVSIITGCLLLFLVSTAFAECPDGTWPRNMYSGPGGGLYTGPGGGMYTGPGGGAYTGPGGGAYTGPGGGMYTGPGGGLYTGPGGGLYSGPGGGLYTGPSEYCSNIPPWPIFAEYLAENGYEDEAELIRSALNAAGY